MSEKHRVWDLIEYSDVQALYNLGVRFSMAFDATHAGEKPHFELNIDLGGGGREKLKGTVVYDKLRLIMISGTGSTKFEIARFSHDLVSNSPKAYQISQARRAARGGGTHAMIQDVYPPR